MNPNPNRYLAPQQKIEAAVKMRNRSQTGKTVVQISNETQISRGHLYARKRLSK